MRVDARCSCGAPPPLDQVSSPFSRLALDAESAWSVALVRAAWIRQLSWLTPSLSESTRFGAIGERAIAAVNGAYESLSHPSGYLNERLKYHVQAPVYISKESLYREEAELSEPLSYLSPYEAKRLKLQLYREQAKYILNFEAALNEKEVERSELFQLHGQLSAHEVFLHRGLKRSVTIDGLSL